MRKHRVLAGILAVVMLLGMMTTAFAAEITSDPAKPAAIPYENGVLLGKEATDVSNMLWRLNRVSKVSLTVNAPTDEFPVAVEFVLDCTESLMEDETTGESFITKYAEAIRDKFAGKNVYVGVTGFTTEARELVGIRKFTKGEAENLAASAYKEAVNLMLGTTETGTNIQAGIRMGLDKLKNASTAYGIPATRCYMVLITDGGSYWWLDGETPANNTCNTVHMGNTDAAEAGYGSFGDLYREVNGEKVLIAKNIPTAQQNYTSDANEPLAAVISDIKEDSRKYTNFETGIYHAAAELAAVNAANMNLITIGYPYHKNEGLDALTNLAGQFVELAASYNDHSLILDSRSDSDKAVQDVVNTISGAINVVVPANSYIIDYIGWGDGYNFDMLTDKEVVLSIGADDYTGSYDEATKTWTFSDAAGKVVAVMEYVPQSAREAEHFKLTTRVDLLRGQKLILSYYIKLVERVTTEGIHTVYTNVGPDADTPAAYLHPDTMPANKVLPFPEPALSYQISDSTDPGIPDEPVPGGDKPELNTTDHYAYIIGRMDGLVHPEAQITRAEVATIYFRMLTDESRTALWSQSNPYPDVQPGMWCNAAVSTMTRAGVIQGYTDGKFHPNDPITRAEFATIAVRFFEVTYSGDDKFSDISNHWAADYINKAAEAALIAGFTDGTFRPDVKITRAQAITIFNRVLGRAPEKDHLLPDMITWPDNLDTNAWYYAAMQEATNSHTYDKKTNDAGESYEVWTKMLPVRDWAAFEKAWSDANSAANPGEVVTITVLN